MIEENFNDFDDLFLDFNRKLINDPEKYVSHVVGDNYYLKPTLFSVLKPEAKLDFSFLGYTKSKFYKLLYNYVDLNNWEKFKGKLKNSKSLSLIFYFNEIKKVKGNNQDSSPCILNMVFSRRRRDVKWEEIYIYYRTTEIDKTFYLDLFLFSKLIEDVSCLCEIKKVNLINPFPFFKVTRSYFLLDYLKLDLDDSNFLKISIKKRKERLKNSEYSKFKANKRVQMYLKGEKEYEKINIEEIKLYREDL